MKGLDSATSCWGVERIGLLLPWAGASEASIYLYLNRKSSVISIPSVVDRRGISTSDNVFRWWLEPPHENPLILGQIVMGFAECVFFSLNYGEEHSRLEFDELYSVIVLHKHTLSLSLSYDSEY